ncbi:MAG: hypothetical protein ACOZAO_03040 [Patescibacteria group bacterium]
MFNLNNLFKKFLFVFILLHLILFNINAAEWGDSYRILRASNYIRDFSYPADEKRPPLFSSALATYPSFVDPVVWGRFIMLIISVLALYFSYKIFKYFRPTSSTYENLLYLMLVGLNPVYLYWSIRLMADVPFSLIVLVSFYLYLTWRNENSVLKPFIVGLFAALSVLTRFEGFILFGSLGLGYLLNNADLKNLLNNTKKRFYTLLSYVFGFIAVTFPYFLIRNPFTSSYFEEPGRRLYDINTAAIFLLSLVFLFGFTSALFFVLAGLNNHKLLSQIKQLFISIPGLLVFILIETTLVLLWPAAVPRLFVAIIPFIAIPIAYLINAYFENSKKPNLRDLFLLGLLLGVFVLGQFHYRLQFLVVMKYVFVFVVILQLFNIFFIYLKFYKGFLFTLFMSLLIWSFSSIWIHKDIFSVIKEANVFVNSRLCGTIGHNDVSSVSDWYLNQLQPNTNISACRKGVYLDITDKSNREYDVLLEKGIDYILVTNEHNTDTTINLSEWPHLEEIAEFEKTVNGKRFFTKVIKFNR